MKVPILGIIVFYLLAFAARAQESYNFYGKVLDNETMEPVPGVYISIDSNKVTFSNEDGVFELLPEFSGKSHKILLSHLAYEDKTYRLKKHLKSDTSIILIKFKYHNIDEVDIIGSKLKALVNRAHKQFVQEYLPGFYWAKSNYKQLIQYKDRPSGYLEIDGFTYMPPPNKQVWGGDFKIVPVELRRTREDEIIIKVASETEKQLFNQLAGPYSGNICVAYSFLERIHPLGKFNFHDYEFHFDSLSEDNKKEYIINFKQKKKINVMGWNLWNINGQIWLDRESLNVNMMECSFNRDRNFINQFTTHYSRRGAIVYPKKIVVDYIDNNQRKGNTMQKVMIGAVFEFSEIDTVSVEDYKIGSVYSLNSILQEYEYDHDYWLSHPVIDPEWKIKINTICKSKNWEEEFMKGSKVNPFKPLSDDYSEARDSSYEASLKMIELMCRDLNLKNPIEK